MENKKPHGEYGHLNIYKRDHDSICTSCGKHDRVIAFCPDREGLYCRIDHCWNIRMPSMGEVLKVAYKQNLTKGSWILYRRETEDGSTHLYFKKG